MCRMTAAAARSSATLLTLHNKRLSSRCFSRENTL